MVGGIVNWYHYRGKQHKLLGNSLVDPLHVDSHNVSLNPHDLKTGVEVWL